MALALLAAGLLAPIAPIAPIPFGGDPQDGARRHGAVTLGIDVLLSDEIERVAGKRLGLITNPSGVDRELVLSADRLAADERVELVQLYAPEHGIRGDVPAGETVAESVDAATGIPVESLYGGHRRPSAESLARIDLLLFDIQDVGSRTYTYISTLGEALQAAAEANVAVLVLDRPNPLGGERVAGPLRRAEHASFIGWGPIPLAHGMTVGEIARFFNAELEIGCRLDIVPMRGWKRSMLWEDTGLAWVQTSPHIPHALHAHLYIATGMVGGTTENVNEGVGSTLPFETIAAEFISAPELHAALVARNLPGLRLRPIHYTPRYGRFEGRLLHGVQLIPSDLRAFDAVRTAVTILCTLEKLYPKKVVYRLEAIQGRHWGDLEVAQAVRAGKRPAEIEAAWQSELAAFRERRARVLLYQ
jgi:uncharacterized protein YbbC (DUF1343 family)